MKKNPRRVKTSGEDQDAAYELQLYAENDTDLYRQQLTPIRLNLLRKYAAGKYDGLKAPKLFEYLMESAAQKYVKEFGGGQWFNVFTPETRRYAARQMAGEFEQAMKAGEYDSLLLEKGGVHAKRLATLRGSVKSNPAGRLIDSIGPGDRVTIVDRFGKERSGKAVMRSSHGGWVLNMGGAHGTPGIADDSNVTRVSKSKKKATGAAHFIAGRAPNPVDKNCPHCGAYATRCAADVPKRRASVCMMTGKVLARWPKKEKLKLGKRMKLVGGKSMLRYQSNPDAYVIALYMNGKRLTYDAIRNRFTDNSRPSLYRTALAAQERGMVILKANPKLGYYKVTVENATAKESGAVFGAIPRRKNPKRPKK